MPDDYFLPSGKRSSKQDKKHKRRFTKYRKGGPRRTIEKQHNAFKD